MQRFLRWIFQMLRAWTSHQIPHLEIRFENGNRLQILLHPVFVLLLDFLGGGDSSSFQMKPEHSQAAQNKLRLRFLIFAASICEEPT